jgi:hypothetical protein
METKTDFIDGYYLRYDWDAYEILCAEFDLDTIDDINDFYRPERLNKLSLKDIRTMLWVGLFKDGETGEGERPQKEVVGKIISKFLKGRTLSDLTMTLLLAQGDSGIIQFRTVGEVEPENVEGDDAGELKGEKKSRRLPRHSKS